MLAPWEEEAYYEWQLRERQAALRDAALDWQSLQQSSQDILQTIPEAEGLREFHEKSLDLSSIFIDNTPEF